MIVSYTHEDGTVEEVSTDDLSAVESAAVESVTDLEWDDVERALKSQRPGAMRAVLWVFRKRSQPTLRFSAFDVPAWKRRLKARLEREEVLDLVETLRKDDKDGDEAGFEEMLGYMRTLAHDPADVDWAVAETGPKALVPVADLPSEGSAAAS
ncbi:hypothetical protein OOK13_40240 [Streptomyces sp. NBC_00378]|uniref:hypothetical protein n=1 Tax=unclassified Streptomyces TaxID=2593676 RepID=UPI00225678A7|nr:MULTISPECIES: hypothetical protein [unclassified Streptomyces]MCX5112213.1 hypothetical protein [Streptomyces sp. NBC_00378]MCX5114592.1 hypothetical protein [Streptomyces sp. NBC_00378]